MSWFKEKLSLIVVFFSAIVFSIVRETIKKGSINWRAVALVVLIFAGALLMIWIFEKLWEKFKK